MEILGGHYVVYMNTEDEPNFIAIIDHYKKEVFEYSFTNKVPAHDLFTNMKVVFDNTSGAQSFVVQFVSRDKYTSTIDGLKDNGYKYYTDDYYTDDDYYD